MNLCLQYEFMSTADFSIITPHWPPKFRITRKKRTPMICQVTMSLNKKGHKSYSETSESPICHGTSKMINRVQPVLYKFAPVFLTLSLSTSSLELTITMLKLYTK